MTHPAVPGMFLTGADSTYLPSSSKEFTSWNVWCDFDRASSL